MRSALGACACDARTPPPRSAASALRECLLLSQTVVFLFRSTHSHPLPTHPHPWPAPRRKRSPPPRTRSSKRRPLCPRRPPPRHPPSRAPRKRPPRARPPRRRSWRRCWGARPPPVGARARMGPAGSSTLGESEMEGWRRERRRRREKGGTAASERRLAPMHAETLRQPHFSLTRIPHPSTHSSHLPHGFYEDALKGVCVRERGEGEAREAGTALQIGACSFSHHFLSLHFLSRLLLPVWRHHPPARVPQQEDGQDPVVRLHRVRVGRRGPNCGGGDGRVS